MPRSTHRPGQPARAGPANASNAAVSSAMRARRGHPLPLMCLLRAVALCGGGGGLPLAMVLPPRGGVFGGGGGAKPAPAVLVHVGRRGGWLEGNSGAFALLPTVLPRERVLVEQQRAEAEVGVVEVGVQHVLV